MGKAWGLNLAILAALAQPSAIVNPANKPTLTELQRFWEKMHLSNYSFFCKKNGSPNFVLPQKRTLQTIHEFQNKFGKKLPQ